ncbi:MAG: Bax inhibitor-1/YccA family protein [Muribaculaceae bacterium]|nr:Bax inhibitor-1/YccA family protein [Muribaculaceae bacterium]
MNYYNTDINSYPQSLEAKVSQVMKGVYVKMFLGLLVTAVVAWIVAATATSDASFLYYMATHSWVYWGLCIVEIGLVLWISAGLRKLSSGMATGLFFLFAIVNGLTLSMIFAVYQIAAIFKTFLITAGVFGAMSVYGYFTNKDLTRIGSFLYMALFGLIILCVVNMFWANSTLEWIVSGLGVLIFIGLTAWDTQQIKQMALADPTMANGRLATLGALSLYLDFINLFLYLLRFFGGNRD